MNDVLRPFWRYYGGKWRAAKKYPEPEYNLIIEPFAGAAGYACHYYKNAVVLCDVNPIICGIWRFLIDAPYDDIIAIGDIPYGGSIDDLNAPDGAKWLAGFWCNNGTVAPCKRPSKWAMQQDKGNGWSLHVRKRIAQQVGKIKHWQIYQIGALEIPNTQATWFVDPPYSTPAGAYYPYKFTQYRELAEWCRSRYGQTIVCEQEGATWLDFKKIYTGKCTPGKNKTKVSEEVCWVNHRSVF